MQMSRDQVSDTPAGLVIPPTGQQDQLCSPAQHSAKALSPQEQGSAVSSLTVVMGGLKPESLNQINSQSPECMPTLNLFHTVCKTTVISLVSINLIPKLSQGVQLELFHHRIKFHPHQMKSEKMKPTGFALR